MPCAVGFRTGARDADERDGGAQGRTGAAGAAGSAAQAVERAVATLKEAGLGVADQREVLVVDVEDRPGSRGELARELADAGVNIELL